MMHQQKIISTNCLEQPFTVKNVLQFSLSYTRSMLQLASGNIALPVRDRSGLSDFLEVMISSWTGFNHGQILIETATHSLTPRFPLAPDLS